MTNEEKNEIKARLELDKMNYWNFLLSGAKETPLTKEQLKDAQEKMSEWIYAVANVNGLSRANLAPITDGVCDFEAYLFSKPKIMWILKEPYDEFTKSGKPKGGDYSISDAIKNADLKNTSVTWKRMAQITHNILTGENATISDLSEEQMRLALSKIAYINVSKMPAQKQTSQSQLKEKYEIWKETLLMQIDLYSPDIIIFGYTFGLFSDDLSVTGDFDYKDKDGWTNIYKKDGRLLVDTYHPANTQPYEYFDYPTAVVKSIQKIWK